MRRRLLRLACLVAPAAAAVLVAAPARAADPTDYAALGDSYSSGVGTVAASGTCARSPQGYPQLWVDTHAVSSFAFVACSGATTDDVLANQLDALNGGTDLVTISIGGNDAGFASTILTCKFGSDSDCLTALGRADTYIDTVLPGKLDRTYAAISGRAPNARVVVLGYPHLYEQGTGCGSAAPA